MGAYDEHVEMQQKRTRAAYLGEKASLDPFAAVRIARASSEIDAAWALLVNNIREEQAYVAKGEKIPLKTRLKVRRDQVLGSQRAIDAIDSLFEASGGRALASGTYLQRAWRDAHAGRVHAANDPERALQLFGAHEFGHKVDPGCTEGPATQKATLARSGQGHRGRRPHARLLRGRGDHVGGGLPLVMLHGGGPGASALEQLRLRAAPLRRAGSARCWSTSPASAPPTSPRWRATTTASPPTTCDVPARRARHRARAPARQQPGRGHGDAARAQLPRPGRPAGADGAGRPLARTCSTPTRPRACSG